MYEFFQEGIDQNERNLIEACIDGKLEFVKKLIESGTNPNVFDEYGNTALSQAAYKGHKDIVDFLLTKNISPDSKNCALLLSCQAGHAAIVDTLLKEKADPNVYEEDYMTPLFQAITYDRLDVFRRLLQEKNLELNKNNGVVPVFQAILNNRLTMLKELVDKGANMTIEDKGWTAKSIAQKKNFTEIIKFIEEKEAALQQKTCQ